MTRRSGVLLGAGVVGVLFCAGPGSVITEPFLQQRRLRRIESEVGPEAIAAAMLAFHRGHEVGMYSLRNVRVMDGVATQPVTPGEQVWEMLGVYEVIVYEDDVIALTYRHSLADLTYGYTLRRSPSGEAWELARLTNDTETRLCVVPD